MKTRKPVFDVVWHAAVSARAGHGFTRATFHQHAHGGFRASGRRSLGSSASANIVAMNNA